jgi:predicted permease
MTKESKKFLTTFLCIILTCSFLLSLFSLNKVIQIVSLVIFLSLILYMIILHFATTKHVKRPINKYDPSFHYGDDSQFNEIYRKK